MNDFLPRGKRLAAQRREWSDSVGFVLFERNLGKISYSTNIEMYLPETNSGELIEPTFYLNRDETQELMDNLWTLGFRPSEGTGSAGALAAVEKHLEDMRKIAFDMLEKHEH